MLRTALRCRTPRLLPVFHSARALTGPPHRVVKDSTAEEDLGRSCGATFGGSCGVMMGFVLNGSTGGFALGMLGVPAGLLMAETYILKGRGLSKHDRSEQRLREEAKVSKAAHAFQQSVQKLKVFLFPVKLIIYHFLAC